MEPLSEAEAKESELKEPENIVPSRWLDSWKEKDADFKNPYPSEYDVPDRIVAKSRCTPTPEVNEVLWILQILAGQQWRAFVADASAAFNQSETNMRTQPLHVRLPPSGLPGLPVLARIARLTREVYGLATGSCAWRITVLSAAFEAGFCAHSLAPCVLLYHEPMVKDAK
eukprot:3234491-Amphidinium_carterae.1